jgi:hypothetical protein
MDQTFGKTPMPRSEPTSLLLCGYYGEHNLGDDALLQVLLQALPVSSSLIITAHDQAEVQGMAPHARIVNRRSLRFSLMAVLQADVLILGGGSLPTRQHQLSKPDLLLAAHHARAVAWPPRCALGARSRPITPIHESLACALCAPVLYCRELEGSCLASAGSILGAEPTDVHGSRPGVADAKSTLGWRREHRAQLATD